MFANAKGWVLVSIRLPIESD